MLLLGPDSPTMMSVTADVKLVNTESESPSDGGTTGTNENKPEPRKNRRVDPKTDTPRAARDQVQQHLRESTAEVKKALDGVKKALDDSARRAGLKPADPDGDSATPNPLPGLKLPTFPKLDLADAPNATATVDPKRRSERTPASALPDSPAPGHRITELTGQVAAALANPTTTDDQRDTVVIPGSPGDPSGEPAPVFRQVTAFVAPSPDPAPTPAVHPHHRAVVGGHPGQLP